MDGNMSDNKNQPILLDLSSNQDWEKMSGLPNNLPAEQNFLGALLVDNTVLDKLSVTLQAEHFFDPVHGKIFEAANNLIGRGNLANQVTLRAFFSNRTDFGAEGAEAYLEDIVEGVISIADAKDYANVIFENFIRRELVRITDSINYDARNPELNKPALTQIETAEQYLFNLAEKNILQSEVQTLSEVIAKTIKMAEIASQNDGHLSGISTGLSGLNNLLGGMHKSDLIILAGRPAMGKTALATNIAFHAATTTRTGEKSVPVLFFSQEMAAEQLGGRILADLSMIDSVDIRRGRLNNKDFNRLSECNDQIHNASFYIDDTPALSVSQIASRSRRMKRTTGLGLVVIDYLQLLRPEFGYRPENKVQEISNISKALKAIAKELDVPVLALSQLSRAVEQREDKHPGLADLRDSGSIEQDADVVIFVYREEYYLSKSEPEMKGNETDEKYNDRVESWQNKLNTASGKAELIVAKQRLGPVGTISVSFDGRFTKFSDLAQEATLPDDY